MVAYQNLSTELSPVTPEAPKRQREAKLLRKFISTYCRENHVAADLCRSCEEMQTYALARLEVCPYHPKPACRRCPTHCYTAPERERIREIMRFSGMYYVRRGRLDWLVKYFLLT